MEGPAVSGTGATSQSQDSLKLPDTLVSMFAATLSNTNDNSSSSEVG